MSDAQLPLDRIQEALRPLHEAMKNDGYDLTVRQRETGYVLQVDAMQNACKECLVPKRSLL